MRAFLLQAVHASLQQQFQIREPRLLRLLGHLLVAHSAHFMAQRCKDGFEGELGIPQLRGPGVVPAAEQQWRSARQAAAAGAHMCETCFFVEYFCCFLICQCTYC